MNSDICCQHLNRWKLTTDQKQPELAYRRGVVFHRDNTTPHTSVVTRLKLRQLGWVVLMYPPYSPDVAPNDYFKFSRIAKVQE
ncbi:putative DD34D transposase [Trichonephila clavipes]|nr:putative DD34D transposase [Trichonephila clavipes]